jgi:F0F1-type ATP synthase assembly protein I
MLETGLEEHHLHVSLCKFHMWCMCGWAVFLPLGCLYFVFLIALGIEPKAKAICHITGYHVFFLPSFLLFFLIYLFTMKQSLKLRLVFHFQHSPIFYIVESELNHLTFLLPCLKMLVDSEN